MAYSLDSRDGYVRRIIAVGRAMGIQPRGIVIGIATGLAESNIKVYANPKVPESMRLPHDAVASDGKSVGIFQQQVVMGNGWWWGDAETCMGPESSARLFFERLAKRNYMTGDAGAHAQAVQGSAYPDRYGQRMNEAQQLYDRLAAGGGGTPVGTYYDTDRSDEFDFGGPRTLPIAGICVHDTEGVTSAQATDETDDNTTTYQCTSRTGSYHIMVGVDGERIRQNTDDWTVWATGNKGNDVLLHICFVGSARQTRAEWLAQDKMLRAGATVIRYWSDKYSVPLKKVTAAGLPGVLGHVDTQVWGGTDHTDPGPNFPYDKVLAYAKAGATTTVPLVNQINVEADVAKGWIGKRLTDGEKDAARGGKFADFENGSIYWHPKVRKGLATAVPAHIMEAWAALDWENGFLGYPKRRHTIIAGVGDVQAFEGGVIYRRYGQPGFPVRGIIGERWAAEGFETGPLGWPVSDEEDNGTGGRVQRFENGSLSWDASGAVKTVQS
ncbi:N-acetylmuramoyl-L-alanine amidase [Gordonia sp. HY285]|uniref:N-acetylmuramoyl-L-alanine amidase n=1 Tax=Gordonia liuliyuniae TaxID=2911517 RepID=UPI001F031ECC|nr:N-acetylmuramoyl-L-alanine amidase [Gordonia liuliyuniae]MCF8610076.1 N-acetylmuramoyl-L-alanine amidase [Gordonia liuliyuniae]